MKFHEGEIDFITLGCSKNLVDAERVMRQLEAAGWRCVHDAEDPQGEICVINTCGFIGDAKEESVNMILQMAERKKEKKLRKLIVMGCLSERYRAELEAELPEVDEYFGKFDFENLTLSLPAREGTDGGCHPAKQKKSEGSCASYERKLTTPKHYAYPKISEGCNRMCSYCAIPLITGRHTSRPKEDILDEVRWLVSQGVKELNVIAQDLSNEAIAAIIGKFETDGTFNPENVVLFGYSFTWTEMESLKTNLARLKDTEKNLRINFDIRY